ncbi:CAP-Gly domain-containing protein [Ditylenchus destructor]|uniref:CAP-Gly domain-containing protein n=1 Tax=Ditylenchus destructor TaxID=166010 RepID=A0AAD4NJ13_9BILA|nr:CAP-Gly domain-containing protein [Ditylenchus destructor]
MNKSVNDSATDPSRVVSRLDVGKRVTVNGHFGGVLKYVGKVASKPGIFCGVELDQPIGKHDGSHHGVVYFESKPKHGIFAPTYKVQLEGDSSFEMPEYGNLDKPSLNSSNRRPNQLISKSAIPALGGANNFGGLPSNGAMDCSLMSTTSSYSQGGAMDQSFLSSVSSSGKFNGEGFDGYGYGGVDDLMMNSNHTYIVTDSDCLMLSDIEISDGNLLRLDDDDDDSVHRVRIDANRNAKNLLETSQATSVILEGGPTLDPSLLPVIGDSSDEEASTPMVELISNAWLGHTQSTTPTESKHITNPASAQDAVNHNHVSTTKGPAESKSDTKLSSKNKANNATKESNQQQQNSVNNNTSAQKSKPKTAMQQNNAVGSKKFDTSSKSKPVVTNNLKSSQPTTEDQQPGEQVTTKKPRVPIREMQKPKPATPRGPKPPSKSQEIMDKLKASIEAEKQKPKMVAKPKVCTVIQPITTPTDDAEDTENPNAQVEGKSLPTENDTTDKESMPNPTDQRAPVNNSTSSHKPSVVQGTGNKTNTNRASARSTAKCPAQLQAPLAQTVRNPPAPQRPGSRTRNHSQSSVQKPSVTVKPPKETVTRVPLKPKQPLPRAEKEQISEIQQQLQLKHEAELSSLQQKHNEESSALKNAHDQELKQQKEVLRIEHEQIVAELKQKIETANIECSECRKVNEELVAEKKLLEEKLAKSEDEKIKELNDEVNSMKYALECKDGKLNDLRKQNQKLQFSVDTIPEKDVENQKLSHRVSDLKLELNQQREFQKALTQQLEEAKKEARNTKAAYENLQKEHETLRFKLEETATGERQTSSPGSYVTANQSFNVYSPGQNAQVNMRASSDRPTSSSGRPNSTSCYSARNLFKTDGMAKSWDSSAAADATLLSLYKEQGLKRIQNTPNKDKIYAPDGTFEVGDAALGKAQCSSDGKKMELVNE